LNEIIVAGPWIGEFGPEIEDWIPRLRYFKSQHLESYLIVSSYPGREIIYSDFANDFLGHPNFFTKLLDEKIYNTIWNILLDTKTKQAVSINNLDIQNLIQWLEQEIKNKFPNQEINYINPFLKTDKYNLDQKNTLHLPIQTSKISPWTNHIVIFPRNRITDSFRNWPESSWYELVCLLLNNNYKVVLCGNIADSLSLDIKHDNFLNILGSTLEDQVMYTQSAQLALTSFSGACRFTAYIGCPTVTWGNASHLRQVIVVEGKAFDVNPFNTPLYILAEENRWTYSSEEVFNFVKQYLKEE